MYTQYPFAAVRRDSITFHVLSLLLAYDVTTTLATPISLFHGPRVAMHYAARLYDTISMAAEVPFVALRLGAGSADLAVLVGVAITMQTGRLVP